MPCSRKTTKAGLSTIRLFQTSFGGECHRVEHAMSTGDMVDTYVVRATKASGEWSAVTSRHFWSLLPRPVSGIAWRSVTTPRLTGGRGDRATGCRKSCPCLVQPSVAHLGRDHIFELCRLFVYRDGKYKATLYLGLRKLQCRCSKRLA